MLVLVFLSIHSLPPDNTLLDIWQIVLISFDSVFSLSNSTPETMAGIHKDKSLDLLFFDLLVFKLTFASDLAFKMLNLVWLANLCDTLNLYTVDAYNLGYPAFTWRLVRPGYAGETRSLYRDQWFRIAFQLSTDCRLIGGPKHIDSSLPSALQTDKVWLALNNHPGESGLLVAPSSQLSNKPSFSIVSNDGFLKPLVNSLELLDVNFMHAMTSSRSFVLYGEELMHGGASPEVDSSKVS